MNTAERDTYIAKNAEEKMKPRNTIMALVAKNDPTRYHTRSVEAECVKIQRNRARRRSKERKEIQSNCQGESQQLHCDVTQVVKGVGCGPAIHGFESRTSPHGL
jgi:hypothetical protein